MMMVFAVAVVMVGVDRQHLLLRSAKQTGKFGVTGHALRFAVTADVAVEADHLVVLAITRCRSWETISTAQLNSAASWLMRA